LANHPNRYNPQPHPTRRTPDDATPAEEMHIDRCNVASEAAMKPWLAVREAASARLAEVDRSVDLSAAAVQRAERALSDARAKHAAAVAKSAAERPARLAEYTRARKLLDAVRSAIISAWDAGGGWRISASGRIVSADGAIDLHNTDHATQIALLKNEQ